MIKLMIFDNDMTLTNSSHAIVENFNLVADDVGKPHVTHEQVMSCIALPLNGLSETLLGEYHPEWRAIYLEKAAIVEPKMLRPFPDTVPALSKLRDMGIKLAVASNREDPTPSLRWMGIDGYFDAAAGGCGITVVKENRSLGRPLPYKPDPAMLTALADYLGVKPEHTAYVGDACIDIETACAANMRGIGITRCGITAETFFELGAWRVIDSLEELPDIAVKDSEASK